MGRSCSPLANPSRHRPSAFQSDPSQWGTAQFTPDGAYLVVAYGDGTGFAWPTTVAAWVAQACTVAGRNLTREEWQRYVPHRTYASVCGGVS